MKRNTARLGVSANVAGACLVLALGACSVEDPLAPPGGNDEEAEVSIGAGGPVPMDGQCMHVIATRLSDFLVSQYQGPVAGANIRARSGEHRVTATAYPPPCVNEPADPPWIADEQIVTFTNGHNTLQLNFRKNVNVDVDPTFFDDEPAPLIVRNETHVRLGRNGEDAAGSSPSYSLDGWNVNQIVLPPGSGEVFQFSTEGKGLPYTPRGMARTSYGFVFQVAEIFTPLRVLDSNGALIDTWNVVYSLPNPIFGSNTDGLDAIDDDNFVRTWFLNIPINCDDAGNGCIQSGIEILHRTTGPGGTFLEVTQQIPLPEPYNFEYALGVTPVGSRYAVTTLPEGGGSRLLLLNADRTVEPGITAIAGGVEGLFVDGTSIVALDYTGHLSTYDSTSLAPLGVTADYPVGLGLSNPFSVAWRSKPGSESYLVLANAETFRLVSVSPTLDQIDDIPFDFSGYFSVTSIEYRPDTDELAVIDRIPPIDPSSGLQIPVVDFYNLTTGAKVSVTLQPGASLPLRPRTIAFIPARQQIVSHYRRPGNPVDLSLDAMAFVHNLDGSLAASFDLHPLGFNRIVSVSYLPASDELLFHVRDLAGISRLLVTDSLGNPRRSYRTDAIPLLTDLAPIAAPGPFAGDVGVITGQPSEFVRISLP